MVDFLRKAGMIVLIIALVSKQVKIPMLPRKKVDFSGWKKYTKIMEGGKIGNDGTMNDT